MKLRMIRPALALACICGVASAAGRPAYFAAHYACDDRLRIRVAYPVDHLAGYPITLRISGKRGKRVTMRPTVSASGARYANREKRLEWFIKGDEGMLIDDAVDRTVHCKVSSPRKRKGEPSSS